MAAQEAPELSKGAPQVFAMDADDSPTDRSGREKRSDSMWSDETWVSLYGDVFGLFSTWTTNHDFFVGMFFPQVSEKKIQDGGSCSTEIYISDASCTS